MPLAEGRVAKAFVVAAPHSGSGKTLITLGLLRALRQRGLAVRSCKAGPDYIDPGFHAAATGAPCFNLDLWTMGSEACRALLAKQAAEADVVVVEGVMGLFDGPQGAAGSTADLASALGLPVVLVIDCSHQAQSIAALVQGFTRYRQDLVIAGLILNRVKSDRHLSLLREALLAGPEILGVMRHTDSVTLPSRHLGLVQAQELQALETVIETAASGVARETILDKLIQIGSFAPNRSPATTLPPPGQRIAVAHDTAFSFSYPHLLEGWRAAGADLQFFSPLADEAAPGDADFVFLPGGYPELHAGRIAGSAVYFESLRRSTATIYGECGGYMVLGQGLTDAQGQRHPMAGLLPHATSFATRKLHLGYRQLCCASGPFPRQLRGHEFHYSTEEAGAEPAPPLFQARSAAGDDLGPMGQKLGRVMGSYAHIMAEAAS